jgi:transposase
MSQEKYSTEIISLQDKDIVVNGVIIQEDAKTIIVYKPIEKSNNCCVYCGNADILVNSYHHRLIRYPDIGIYKSIIKYKQRRFFCRSSKKTFNETSSLVEKGSTIFNQSKVLLLDKLRLKSSFIDVAKT